MQLKLKQRLVMSGIALCLSMTSLASAKSITVVASFTVLADVVQNVGGEGVIVKTLVPPNGDPHSFEPSPTDAKALRQASLSFISGDGLEVWFQRLSKASGSKVTPVVVSQGIATKTFNEEGKKVTDPHVWNSIPNVLVWVDNIEKALSKANPEDTAVYKKKAQAYRKRLKALDTAIRSDIAAVHVDKREVLTSHDAFGYYEKEYGVRFFSAQGLSTETEASASDVAKLIDLIKAKNVKVYFVENSNNSRLVKQIALATGAVVGGELYPESLSNSSGPVPTYEKLMRFNTDQIVKAISR